MIATLDAQAIVSAFDYATQPKETLTACVVCGVDLPPSHPTMDRLSIPISVTRCWNCRVELINPRLTAEGYDAFYRDVYRQVTGTERAADGEELGRYIAWRLQRAGVTPTGSVVDVGGGVGTVASGLQSACPDARVVVRDPNTDDLAQARSRGLATEVGCLEDVTGPYDGALCVRALDHVRYPVDGLKRLRDAVVPGGWLYVDIVDVWKLRQQYGPWMFWKIDHPVSWTSGPFLRALQISGWTVRAHGWVTRATRRGEPTANTYMAVCRNERT